MKKTVRKENKTGPVMQIGLWERLASGFLIPGVSLLKFSLQALIILKKIDLKHL